MTTPFPHTVLFGAAGPGKRKGLSEFRSSSYVVSLGLHLLGLTILMAVPFIEAAYQPNEPVVGTTPNHVILYYSPGRVRALPPPMIAKRRTPSVIFHPRPLNVPAPPKRDTFTAPAPPVIAAAVPEHSPDIPQSPLPAVRPPAKLEPAKPVPVKTVKVGAFGDPNGIAPAQQSSAPSLIATAGAFDSASNSSSGRTSAGGNLGALRTGSFGDGTPGSGGASSVAGGNGSVHTGGFGDGAGSAQPERRQQPQVVASTPLQILSHPKPTYSQEARQRKVEGVVDLEVLFRANGEIQVLRVVHSLGYGLDEAAQQVANQIRFRPGTRDGVPVDSKTIVHVTFELT